jgi:hypothetical protein
MLQYPTTGVRAKEMLAEPQIWRQKLSHWDHFLFNATTFESILDVQEWID